jgi:uncharacterized protein (TIGR00369 family)
MTKTMPPNSPQARQQAGQPLDPAQERKIRDRIEAIPAYQALKINIETFEVGRCVAIMPIMPEFNGIFGTFHGGLLATAADTITCFALLTQTDPDERMATTDLSIRFLAPCRTDVRVDARVIKCGRTLCPIQADLYDMDNKLVAVVQATYMRL